jgi:hypothetical protein
MICGHGQPLANSKRSPTLCESSLLGSINSFYISSEVLQARPLPRPTGTLSRVMSSTVIYYLHELVRASLASHTLQSQEKVTLHTESCCGRM